MVAPGDEDYPELTPLITKDDIRPLFESMASDETRFFTVGFWVMPMYEVEEDGNLEEEIKPTTFAGPSRHLISIIVGWMATGAILAYVEQEPLEGARNRVLPIYKGEVVEGKEGVGKSPAPENPYRRKKVPDGRDRTAFLKARRAQQRKEQREQNKFLKSQGIEVKEHRGNVPAQRARAKAKRQAAAAARKAEKDKP